MSAERERWLQGEADAWFTRNRGALVPHRDPVVRLLDEEGVAPGSVLEVGCANGWRLATLVQRGMPRGVRVRAVGVEPSHAAIADGWRLFGEQVEFYEGHAAALPPDVGAFDLLVLSFVLHWVPRIDLPPLVASLRSLRRPEGLVVVADFYPDRPQRVRYHHSPGLWTYKEDYGPWLARRLRLSVLATRAFDHRALDAWAFAESVPAKERCAVWLLGPKRLPGRER